jgi:hypothetical protein
MKVKIKDFNVDMEVRNNGIEFEVCSADGAQHLGDLILTKTKLDGLREERDRGTVSRKLGSNSSIGRTLRL